MHRRSFVKTVAASLAAAPLLAKSLHALDGQINRLAADVAGATTDLTRWRRVRDEFLMNPGLVHLNTGSLGCAPRIAIAAAAEAQQALEADPVHTLWGALGNGMEDIRDKAATFIGATKDEVAITRNTTEGMNAVAGGLDLAPGDEVLTTNHEHGGGMSCWQWLREHRGIKLVYIPMPAPATDADQIVGLVEKHLTPRTKVCSFSHVETITGIQMPLARIAAITRPRGILLVCDGAQAPGMLTIDVKALGVDTYASSSHKWLLAPKGSGLLYVRKEAKDRVHPIMFRDGFGTYSGSFGTRDVATVIGHGVAIDFHNALGRERIEARCRQLNQYLRDCLATIPALRLLTPAQPELATGIVTYALDREPGSNGKLAEHLRSAYNIVVKTVPGTYAYVPKEDIPGQKGADYNALRFSTHLYNDEVEIERLASGIKGWL